MSAQIKPKEIDDIIKQVLHDKLTNYISGRITSELTRLHHGNQKPKTPKKEIKEDEGPLNVMGTSSSTSGTGPIDTFDPLMAIKKRLKRKSLDGTQDSKKVS